MQNDPIKDALTSQGGECEEIRLLMNRWLEDKPQEGQGLNSQLKARLTEICRGGEQHRPSRAIIAVHTDKLFDVDRSWTRENLIPSFRWLSSAEEARFAWSGFLVSPHIYPQLWKELKNDFIEAAKHYRGLGECRLNYAYLTVMMSVDQSDFLSGRETGKIIDELPDESWDQIAKCLYRLFDLAGKNRQQYWQGNMKRFIGVLLKHHQGRCLPEEAAGFLARICLAEAQLFCSVFEEVKQMLRPISNHHPILNQLNESDICHQHSEQALDFLSSLIDPSQLSSCPDALQECLNAILANQEQLGAHPQYQDFFAQCQKCGYVQKTVQG